MVVFLSIILVLCIIIWLRLCVKYSYLYSNYQLKRKALKKYSPKYAIRYMQESEKLTPLFMIKENLYNSGIDKDKYEISCFMYASKEDSEYDLNKFTLTHSIGGNKIIGYSSCIGKEGRYYLVIFSKKDK